MAGPLGAVSVKNVVFKKTCHFAIGPPCPVMADFVAKVGCLARRRADRAHSLPPSSRRAAPPIYPDLLYDRHRAKMNASETRKWGRAKTTKKGPADFYQH